MLVSSTGVTVFSEAVSSEVVVAEVVVVASSTGVIVFSVTCSFEVVVVVCPPLSTTWLSEVVVVTPLP